MKRLSLQGLQPGTDYSVQVRSVLQGETSEWSQSLDFTTTLDYNPPLDVTGLLWQSKGTSWLATWNHIDQSGAVPQNNDFSHYEVRVTYSGTDVVYTTQNNRLEFTLEQNISSFGQPRNPLSVAIRTVDVSGNAGNWVSHASVSNPAPGAPSSISATQGIERIALAWSPPSDSDIDYYRVYTSASSGGTYTLAASPRTNSFVYETTSTAMVYFRVFTVDIFGTESTTYASANQQAKPSSTPDTTPPAAPTAVTVTPGFDSIAQQAYVDIAWTNPTAADLNVANIRYGNNGSTFSYLTLAATSAAAQTHRLNVAAGSSVYVGVQAQDFAGNKSAYTNASVYPVTAAADTTPPSQPAAPSVTGGNMIAFVSHNGNKQAGGAMEADVARYEVHASTTSGFTASTSTMIGSINASSVAGSSFPIAATKANPTWYFRVVAVDRSGNRSTVSNQTTATISVINDSNINQAILDAITEAQVTANGKNKVTHSLSAPGSTPNSIGDTWYQYNGSQQVIGFWRGNGGTSWTAQTLDNVVIATMDAGKINTGVLNADRIGAKSLSTNKLLVSDMTNLLDDPDFVDANTFGKNWIDMSGGGGWSVVTGEAGAGKALTATALNGTQRRTANYRATRVRAGDAFVITTRYAHNVAGSTPYIALMYRNAAGTVVATQTISLPATAGAWTTLASSQQIVPNTAGIETVHYEFTISSTATSGGTLTVQNPKFFKAANGELIVDGAITAQKVAANAISTKNLTVGSITDNLVPNGKFMDGTVGTYPEGWTATGGGIAALATGVTGTAGPNVFRITRSTSDTSGISSPIPINPTEDLYWSIFASSSPAVPSGAKLTLRFLQSNGSTVISNIDVYSGALTTTMTQYQGTLPGSGSLEPVKIPSNASWVQAVLTNASGTSQMNFNEVDIRIMVGTAHIIDAAITTAKVKSLKADKLEAGSGVVSELIIKDGLDPLTNDPSTGVIRSDNYNAVARTGFKLDKNKLDLFEGAVDAKTINLRNSFNIMPASMATFESRRDFYQENMLLSNCNVDVSTEAAVGDQALQITTTGANWSATLGTAPNIVLEPNRKYILSFLAKGSTGTENLKARLSYSTTADEDPLPTEIIDVTLGTDYPATPYHTVISNLTNEMAFVKFEGPSAGKQITIDCVQVEEQVGSLTTPSRWQPPSFTSITGGQISTGSIQSQDTSSGRPAWSIDLEGDAIFSSAKILGSLTVGEGSEDTSYIQSGNYGEVVGDIIKGWKINADGTAEFNSATMRGKATLNSAEIIGSLSVVKRSESEVGSVELNPDTVTTIYGNLTSPPAPKLTNKPFDGVSLAAPSSGVDPKTRQNRSGPATDASGNIYVGYTYDDSSAGITYLGVSKYNSAGVWQAENIVEVDGELGLPKIIGFNHVTSNNTLFVMLDTGMTGSFNPIYTFNLSSFASAPTESYIEYNYPQIQIAYKPWVHFTGTNYYWAYCGPKDIQQNIILNPRIQGTISSNWSVARGYTSTTLTAGSGSYAGELIISSNTNGSAIKGAVPTTSSTSTVMKDALVYVRAMVNPTATAVKRARIRVNWSNGSYSYSDNFMMTGVGVPTSNNWQEISFVAKAQASGSFQVEFYFDGDAQWGAGTVQVGRLKDPLILVDNVQVKFPSGQIINPVVRSNFPIYGDGSHQGWSWGGTENNSPSSCAIDQGIFLVEKRTVIANQLGNLVSMQLSDRYLHSDITGLYVGNGDYTAPIEYTPATDPMSFAITRKQSTVEPGNYFGLTFFSFVNTEPTTTTPVTMVNRESAFGDHSGICWNTTTGKFNLLNLKLWNIESYSKMYSSNGISVAVTHYSSTSGKETLMSPITVLNPYFIRQKLSITGLVPPNVPPSVPSGERPTGYRVYLGTADATDRTKMQRVLTTTGWPTSIDITDNTLVPRGTAPTPILVPGTYTATAAIPGPATNGFGGVTGFTPAIIKSSNDVFTVNGMGAGRISGLSFSENGLVLDAGISSAAGKITTNTGGFILNHNGSGKIAGFDFTPSQISSTTGGLYLNSDGTGAMPMLFQTGTESITPVANDPTSKSVTFPVPFPAGATIRVFTTPNTTVPYSSVRLTTVTDQTNTGFKLWIYRVNNTSTQVNWVAYAEY